MSLLDGDMSRALSDLRNSADTGLEQAISTKLKVAANIVSIVFFMFTSQLSDLIHLL